LAQLFLAGSMDRFVTFAAAVLDPVQNAVTVVNAGHMPPLLYCPTSGTLVDAIDADLGGPPLGLVEGYQYQSAQVALQQGDSLILYTDGVTDASNAQNQPFAMKGIRAAVLNEDAVGSGPPRPEVVGRQLLEAVRKHSAGRAQNDDIALVCFGRLDPTASGPLMPVTPA
jgi:serine phosphatase RsbU (regulator of sigma subunit)